MTSRAMLLGLCLAVLGAAGCRRDGEPKQDSTGASALVVLGDTPEFSLVDQAGKVVTRKSFEGKVWAAAFMFTRCPTICPEITRRMKSVQDRARAASTQLDLVSFSVDPDNDTPAVLTKYASDFGASLDSWHFLTGSFDVIAKAAEQGFKIAVERHPEEKEHGGIRHGSHLVLVDQRGKIRGYYRTSDDAALEGLLRDAAALAE